MLTWWQMFNGCSSITYFYSQWLDVGAVEAEVVAEEGVEAGEAQGDDLWASLALSETPLFVHVCLFFFSLWTLRSFCLTVLLQHC